MRFSQQATTQHIAHFLQHIVYLKSRSTPNATLSQVAWQWGTCAIRQGERDHAASRIVHTSALLIEVYCFRGLSSRIM